MINKTTIKWAAILFVATLIWMMFEKYMGWHGEKIDRHAIFTHLYDGLFLVVFILAFRKKRKKMKGRAFRWSHGFKFGLGITLIMSALSPLTQILIHKFISPEFFPNVINYAVENGALTREAAENQFNLKSYIIQNIIGTFTLGGVISAVLALVFRKRGDDEKD